MATSLAPSPAYKSSVAADDLLLRETEHRCSNDLQLVVSLLALQSRQARGDEARQALGDAMERVAILARSRAALNRQRQQTVEEALSKVCDALRAQAELRSIHISLRVDGPIGGLSATRVTTLALVVNELATNAIKHAFEQGKSGRITIEAARTGRDVTVTVDDDGLPYPDPTAAKRDGLGLGLARRLMASIDGLLIAPTPPGKMFTLRVPVED